MHWIIDVVQGFVQGLVKSGRDWFRDWRHDEACKKRLKDMLSNPRFGFGRRIEQLEAGIGADRETTKRLLLAIGARPSETDPDLWTLEPPPSRAPSTPLSGKVESKT